ncbi:hypothetical protein LMG28688_07148 [Paraburkholderia caffeinitolerans]|uniref:Uncharacterized protein n=1 Tax=Paraburkholderia caffeinitolerans TaxID=1723730 RepID=A0A6J5H1F9_9BURK|nr:MULTISPECIES: hypothetical protein [Paraburkholderia]CAB3810094.1 hypothetical protein LMG28688_07148 [Paraburkholderia caffeinitolerans]
MAHHSSIAAPRRRRVALPGDGAARVGNHHTDEFAPGFGVTLIVLNRLQQEQQRGPLVGAVFDRDSGIAKDVQEKNTGLGTSGLTVTVGTNKLATTDQESSVTNNTSTVGSLNGDLSIQAGNTLHVTGSDLVAGGNLAGTAANVIIDAATDTSHQAQTQKQSSSGVTIGLAGSVGDAINNAYSESQAAKSSTSTGMRI